jgi:hypothetical protein
MGKTLLRCLDCNRLLLLGPHNQAPAYRLTADGAEPTEIPQDDEAAFRAEHAGHRLGALEVIEGSSVSTGPWGDPMRESYFEATDGVETFVVRRWRTEIDRPVKYEVVPGALEIRPISIEVQSRDLERQLRADFPDNLDPDHARHFVRAVEEVAGNLEYDDLEEVCLDQRDPLLIYLRLDEKQVGEIVDRLGKVVPADTLQRLHKFILENREGNDVMNLVARKAFTVREGDEGEIPSAPP